ncbi:FAD-dependent monooxygenase [Zavarzinia sp. CC-PAN008]|uniref:FAD-dependent monooxygenase n=1 Tax=Zavarzinia sp. CC-PAN008 TaxID=3243332 RepID=UPI003F7480E9
MPQSPSIDVPARSAVAIAGGGMVGGTLALALGRAGIPVVLVDAEVPEVVVDAAFDGRVSAIADASCRLFEALGLWPALQDHAQPIRDIRVSDGRPGEPASPLFLHFDHRAIGDRPFGHIIENRAIRQALHAALRATPAVRWVTPARGVRVAATEAGAVLHLADGTALRADLVVAADGRASALRQAAGIRLVGWDYGQTGIVVTVAHERPHDGTAVEHFLPAGPFAMLPMTGNRSSLVWTETRERAQRLLAAPRAVFVDELARRFGDHLGALSVEGPVWSYPLGFHLADRFAGPRLALAGDSAHGIHPIAGQGLNLGLRDVAALAQVLCEGRRLGQDLGEADLLARYERWRRSDSLILGVVTDGLNRLFSNDVTAVRTARDLGLAAVERMGPLKRFFMRHAAGHVGTLPRLLRGEAP